MIKTRISVSIDRTREDVFDYFTDPANGAQWQSSVQSSQWASQPPYGVGSTQNSVNRFLGRKIESTVEVTAWDRPSKYGFKVIEGPVPLQGVAGLTTSGEYGTELTMDIEAEFGGFFKLAEGLVGKQLEKTLDTDFNALKLVLEGDQG